MAADVLRAMMCTAAMSHGKILPGTRDGWNLPAGDKEFRLTRNFAGREKNEELVCLTDGEVLSVADGDLSVLLGGDQ